MLNYLYELHFAIFSFCFINAQAFSSFMVSLEQTYFPIRNFQANYDDHLVLIRIVCQWVDDILSYSPAIETILNYTHSYLSSAAICLVPSYLVFLLFFGIFLTAKFLISNKLLTSLLIISEQEFATPKAVTLLLSLMFCILISTLGATLFGINLSVLHLLYLTTIGSLLYLVALIPFNLIYNWGAYFPIYIKGQSIKKNILFELLTDYIHLLSFFLRINIQLIRLVIITCVFYMYNEMYIEFIYPTLNSTTHQTGVLGFIYTGASFTLKLLANLLYEVGHL